MLADGVGHYEEAPLSYCSAALEGTRAVIFSVGASATSSRPKVAFEAAKLLAISATSFEEMAAAHPSPAIAARG